MAEHLLIPKRLARALPALRRISWRVEAAVIRSLVWWLRSLSLERATRLSRALIRLLAPLTPMWPKVARNHRIAFPDLDDRARARLRRDVFSSLGSAVAELVCADRIWAERDTRLEFIADPAIRSLREAEAPMVFVSAHVGAWQLACFLGRRYGFQYTLLYAVESNPYFAQTMLELRQRLLCRWLPNQGGVRTLIEELRQGHSIGLAVDTRMDQGQPVPFFGHPAMTNTVPARLALKQRCELVPVHVERLPGTRFRVCLEAPIVPRDASAAPAQQALDMTTQLNARFEEWIRKSPGEWMCLARRWPKDLDKAAA
jgi:KDO2-lipid IV(A) lauroyltransferase